MDLSALGLPMEQLRDVWLIAFMVYLGLCLLVDIAYPVPIKKEKAADLYLEVSGSPVDEARRATAERTAMGAPLSSSRKGSATKKAKKKLDSIEGAGVFSGWFHVVMYLWGWIVAVSTFSLYWDIVYDGVVLPALLLPFLMVYLGARIGRRQWRAVRGYSKDDRVLGMPRIYSATLGKLSAPFRVRGTVPGVEPIRDDRTAYWILGGIAFLLALVFLTSLAGWSIDEDWEAIYIGNASWFLAAAYIPLIIMLLMYNRDYVLYNPDSFQAGRLFLPAKSRPYSEVRAFRVYPKNPDAIKLNP
ncbi:sugar dehydrogenase, partial [uncultured Rothia sp.]|uniref:sugar dehydrogenase n=1 Tax=uncultured Rothia sp. TaxID=316088 RepID=UPI00261D57CA